MKKSLLLICMMGMLCADVTTASYAYSLSGKVYYSGSGLPVPKGTPVTHTANFTGGGSVQNTVYTAIDGSFTVTLSTLSATPVGATMKLKASTGFCTGSTNWTCNSTYETKDVWVACYVVNPNLSVSTLPAHFSGTGIQPPIAAVALLEEPGTPVVVQNFQVKLAWNGAQMNAAMIQPGPLFDIVSWSSIPGSGELYVSGAAKFAPVPLPVPPIEPESFFDVFFEVTVPEEELPVITAVTVVPEETQLYGEGIYHYPYQQQTDYLVGELEKCKATFLIDSLPEWQEGLLGKLPNPNIRPTPAVAWEQYMAYWSDPLTEKEGLPYPETTFIPCAEPNGQLYVWGGGGGGGGCEEPGLVMCWGLPQQEGNYASAWRYDYGLDPDLSNCTIQVTVTPPNNVNITVVSFSMIDAANRMRTWWWAVPGVISQGVATTVKINTALTGLGAATPAATGYMNVPGFNITQVQFFDVDENFNYIFGQQPAPPPGGGIPGRAWNYWTNLTVTKTTSTYKGTYIKWSQPPQVLDAGQPPKINGWDEMSVYRPLLQPQQIMADDWQCNDNRPITDIHWWGSFIGWTQPYLPPVLPKAFHIGIWTDVPDPDPANPDDYSHPGQMIWEHLCDNWVWNFAGYDIDPRLEPIENEACFQFNQLLSQDDWFYQNPSGGPEGTVYWLSIAAIYDDGTQVQYPWGWKTRPHHFNDDAVRIQMTIDGIWPPKLDSAWGSGVPIALPPYPDPQAESWDLAFELTTNEPKAPASADLDYSGFVDLNDFRIFATQWLTTQP